MKDDSIKSLQAGQCGERLRKVRYVYEDLTTSFAQVSSVKRAMESHRGYG